MNLAALQEARGRASGTPHGEHYEGEFDEQGQRHGKGVLTWANGNQYDGEWVAGRMTGHAVFTYGGKSGDVYRGGFSEDKKHGYGEYKFANGNTYVGDFLSDKRDGKGEYRWVCGDQYSGQWKEGKMHGEGVTTYANGNRYEGNFVEDQRDGWGKLVCVDGLMFEGEWANNMRNGQGTLTFPNGDQYQGGWFDDQKHGKGIDTFVNGNRFEGTYERNVKAGHGVMQFANRDEYAGEWHNDTMHGKGTYRFSNGYVYEGEWQRDFRHGHGEYTYNNAVYRGEWRDDKRHGKATLIMDDGGETYTGTWVNGKMEGHFKADFQSPEVNHVTYSGSFAAGSLSGEGTFVFDNGVRLTGAWDESRKTKSRNKNELIPMPATVEYPDTPDPNESRGKASVDVINKSEDRIANEQALYIEGLLRDQATLTAQISNTQEVREENLRLVEQNQELQRIVRHAQLSAEMAESKGAQSTESLSTLQEEVEKRNVDVQKLTGLLEEAQRQVHAIQADSSSKEIRIKALQDELEQARRQSAQGVAGHEGRLRELQDALKGQTELVAVRDTRVTELEREVAELRGLKDQVANLQRRASADTEAAQQEAGNLRDALMNAEEFQAQHTAEVQEYQNRVSVLQREHDTATKEAAASEAKWKAAEEERIKMQTLLEQYKVTVAGKQHEAESGMAERDKKLEDSTARLADLEKQLADLNKQLAESEGERRAQLAEAQPHIDLLDDLREAKKDMEHELRLANQEMQRLKDELAMEKKRRKRAEKLNGSTDMSVESWKNQAICLKSELERREADVNRLEMVLETQNDQVAELRGLQRGGGGGGGSMAHMGGNTDDRIILLERRVKELQFAIEEKDKLMSYQAGEIRKVTQLQAQLQTAHDKISALTAGSEANGVKDLARLMAASNQMDTRFLLSLDASKRDEELKKAVLNRGGSGELLRSMSLRRSGSLNSDTPPAAFGHSQSLNLSLSGSGAGTGAMGPKPPTNPRANSFTKPPSRQRRPDDD